MTFRPKVNAVYPRVCGGTVTHGIITPDGEGLSPRVRGNHRDGTDVTECIGSIPACAGEPGANMASTSASKVYPRVCGGTSHCGGFQRYEDGLSPRVRGNLGKDCCMPGMARSIPACAGEPGIKRRNPCVIMVYPRVCGGTGGAIKMRETVRGLSPRVRGNPGVPNRQSEHLRSIPACAGEPVHGDDQPRIDEVYPRVCGGTAGLLRCAGRCLGLSPRVRGNPAIAVLAGGRSRSIPACAGEPLHRPANGTWPRVYPRVCGGTS